jgi:hypothetical protein
MMRWTNSGYKTAGVKAEFFRLVSSQKWPNNAELVGLDYLSIRTFESLHEKSKDVRNLVDFGKDGCWMCMHLQM